MTRDEILALDEEALGRIVEFDFFKRSGNGGQKRNKTSSAVRVVLKEFDIAAEDCTERSQKLNRGKALQKLRRKIAFEMRQDFDGVIPDAVAPSNNKYPLFAAHLLDLLASVNFSLKDCGVQMNLSSSQVEKLLRKDPALWQFVQSKRQTKNSETAPEMKDADCP